MVCPLCSTRKARRTCPALGRQICPVCCGTKRLTEIRCPGDCVYLSSAREHPPAVVQRQQQRDLSVLLPVLGTLTEPQSRLFFLAGNIAARFKTDTLQRVVDEDVAEAAGSLAATYETAQRGVIYEHVPGSLVAQRMGQELKGVFTQVGGNAGSRFERDAAAALRALEKGARTRPAGAADTDYLDLLKRVLGQASFAPESDQDAALKAEGSGLILPGA